jgi:hypothetical protein
MNCSMFTADRADQTEEMILAYEVSDEALETAAGNAIAGHLTLYYCTALYFCPGP